jgi:antitoxin component YwqK of YwqJK toxin-antitoxin module
MNGAFEALYENGSIQMRGTMDADVALDQTLEYYRNGKLKTERNFKSIIKGKEDFRDECVINHWDSLGNIIHRAV